MHVNMCIVSLLKYILSYVYHVGISASMYIYIIYILSRKLTLGKKKNGFHVSAPMLKFMSGISAR